MGNVNDRLNCEETREYNFVGRKKEITKICELLDKSLPVVVQLDKSPPVVVQINGMQEIGKSRVLTQVLKILNGKAKCILKDFTLEKENIDPEGVTAFVLELLGELPNEDIEDRKIKELEKLSVPDAIKVLLKAISKLKEEVVLFLDNVDVVIKCGTFKEHLKEFLDALCKGTTLSKLRVVFTATEKFSMTSKVFSSYKVSSMEPEDIHIILVNVIKEKCRGNSVDDDDDGDDFLCSEIMSVNNRKYIDALGRLCSGLPKLAILIGSQLTDHDGIMEPRDMVVLMVDDYLKTLSPECYPKNDKADTYQNAINAMKNVVDEYFLGKLNRKMNQANTATVDGVVQCVVYARTDAEAKQKMRPLLANNIVTYRQKQKEFEMHPILRVCIIAMMHVKNEVEEKDLETNDALKEGRLQSANLPGVTNRMATSSWELEQHLKLLDQQNPGTDAEAKQKMRPLLANNIVTYRQKQKEFEMHPILRECIKAMMHVKNEAPPEQLMNSLDLVSEENAPHLTKTQPYTEENLMNQQNGPQNGPSVCSRCNSPVELNRAGHESSTTYVGDNNINKCRCSEGVNMFKDKLELSSSGPQALSFRMNEEDGRIPSVEENNSQDICLTYKKKNTADNIKLMNTVNDGLVSQNGFDQRIPHDKRTNDMDQDKNNKPMTSEGAGSAMKGTSEGVGHEIKGTSEGVGREIKGTSEGVSSQMKGTGEGVGHEIKGTSEGVGHEIKGTSEGVGHEIKGTSEGVGHEIKGTSEGVSSQMKGTNEGFGSEIKGTSEGVSSQMKGTNEGFGSEIKGTSEGVSSQMKGTGWKMKAQNMLNRQMSGSGTDTDSSIDIIHASSDMAEAFESKDKDGTMYAHNTYNGVGDSAEGNIKHKAWPVEAGQTKPRSLNDSD